MNSPEYYLWKEPQALTDSRSEEEHYCENCGEALPYHQGKCALMRRTEKVQCSYCPKMFVPGMTMGEHNYAEHREELEKEFPGIQFGRALSNPTI